MYLLCGINRSSNKVILTNVLTRPVSYFVMDADLMIQTDCYKLVRYCAVRIVVQLILHFGVTPNMSIIHLSGSSWGWGWGWIHHIVATLVG